jgi:hypothetical protein
MLHEAGDIEQVSVELFPSGSAPVARSPSPQRPETKAGTLFEFSPGELPKLLHKNHQVIVVSHQFEGCQTAEVEVQIGLAKRQELLGGNRVLKRVVVRISGHTVVKMIEGRLLALVSPDSRHAEFSWSGFSTFFSFSAIGARVEFTEDTLSEQSRKPPNPEHFEPLKINPPPGGEERRRILRGGEFSGESTCPLQLLWGVSEGRGVSEAIPNRQNALVEENYCRPLIRG